MLQTLIRIMGAWVIVQGLQPTPFTAGMLKDDPNETAIILVILPVLASVILGVCLIAFAPRLAPKGNGSSDRSPAAPDMLSAGLILLGTYWLGTGIMRATSLVPSVLMSGGGGGVVSPFAAWYAAGYFVMIAGGIALIYTGGRMYQNLRSAVAQHLAGDPHHPHRP